MQNLDTIANATCNIFIFLSILSLVVLTFGKSDSTIYKYGAVQAYIIKIALIITALGSLANLLTLSTPPYSEILLNTGLAFLFSWMAYFYYIVIILKKNPSKPLKVKDKSKGFLKTVNGTKWLMTLLIQLLNSAAIFTIAQLTLNKGENYKIKLITAMTILCAVQLWSFYSIINLIKKSDDKSK